MYDFTSVESLLKQAIKDKYFPCAVAAIGRRNENLKTFCYGNRCLIPNELPIKKNTLFDLASLTKVIATNTLCMIFLDKGLLSLEDTISKYINSYNDTDKANLTIGHLLTHTTCLPEFLPFYETCRDYENSIELIKSIKYKFTSGTKVVYSDLNYIILGFILESIGKKRLDKLCQQFIFEPLKMNNTCFNPLDNLKNRRNTFAATEINDGTGLPFIGVVHDENARFFNGISGHAGLFSDINDTVTFVNMLMNEGKVNNRQIFSREIFELMISNHTQGLNKSRGYGWIIEGNRCFSHTGFTGTSIYVNLEKNIYTILFTNRVHPTRNNNKILDFRHKFYDTVIDSF